MSNSVEIDDDDNWDGNTEWYTVESLHRTMKHFKKPIEKGKLRIILTRLLNKDPPLVKIQEGGKQDRPQAKGEYALTDEGKIKFREFLGMKKSITD